MHFGFIQCSMSCTEKQEINSKFRKWWSLDSSVEQLLLDCWGKDESEAKKRCMEWVVSRAGRGQNHPQPDICETEDFPRCCSTNFPTRREGILSCANRSNGLQRRGRGAKQTNDHQTNQSPPFATFFRTQVQGVFSSLGRNRKVDLG